MQIVCEQSIYSGFSIIKETVSPATGLLIKNESKIYRMSYTT